MEIKNYFALGVGEAAARNVLLFVVLTVVTAFGLGVGLALEFASRTFGLILTTSPGFIRAFDFGLGLGEAAVRRLLLFGSFALLLGTASDSRPHSNGTIKRPVEMFTGPAWALVRPAAMQIAIVQ